MEKNLTPRQLLKYRERVERVLEDKLFVIGARERKLINERTANGRRYFYLAAKRREGDKMIERFIKVPQNDSKKLLLPFERQVEFAKYFKKRNIIKTRGVIDANLDPKKGVPFAVMETFPSGRAKIGFIENNKGTELLTAREARTALDQLFRLQDISVKSLPLKLRRLLKANAANYDDFEKEIFRFLNKKVRPLDVRRSRESFCGVIERRLNIADLKVKTKALLRMARPIIDAKANRLATVVHGDLAPNNLYVFDSGAVEFLDLEWVGAFNNSALALIYDFGNLRARAWNNEKFRNALDAELLKIYRERKQEELGKMIVRLGIFRSHLKLSGYFENYDWKKQKDGMETRRRVLTEGDIAKAFA